MPWTHTARSPSKSLDLHRRLTQVLNVLSGNSLLASFVTGAHLLGYFLLPRGICVKRDLVVFLIRGLREIERYDSLESVCYMKEGSSTAKKPGTQAHRQQ